MFYTLLFIHILLCVVLIGLVLMQQGKGADMGAAFGGNSSSLFGAGGATDFVTKLTTSLAIAFMVTSILLVRAYTSFSHSGGSFSSASNPLEGSIMKQEAPPVQAEAPALVVAPETKDAAAKDTSVKMEEPKNAEAKPAEVKVPDVKPGEVKQDTAKAAAPVTKEKKK